MKRIRDKRMKIVAFHNFKGGVGSTRYTAHTCIRAREHGLDVVGATLGHLHDLRHHIERADVPWCDGLERLPDACDLLVLDVHSHFGLLDVIKPDLWVMPMYNPTAMDHAMRVLPSLEGPVWWLPTHGYAPIRVAAALPDRVTMARPIPWSDAMVQSYEAQVPVWSSHPGSPGAVAVEALVADVLAHVGLAEACGPIQRRDYGGELTFDNSAGIDYVAREKAARAWLKAYFERVRGRHAA